jgi:plastocyanin
MSDERHFRNRVLVPVLLPTGILVGVGYFIVNLSRVLLAVNKDLSVVVAIGVSIIILAGASWAATRKRIARSTLVTLVALLALAVGASGAVAAKVGERKTEKHEAIAGPSEAPSPSPAATKTSQPTAPAGGGSTVNAANFSFAPHDVTVPAGTPVTWVMADALPHTVTGASGPEKFDSGNLTQGQRFEFTFRTAGTYVYYCIYHGTPDGKGMAGTVTVT